MKRMKKHRIKPEKPETSTSYSRNEEHDLAYYIHDRVELMHQVFSVLKAKELKTIAPKCIRHISIDDLQELCTEELLGISSKRLCAILDGAEPPSDTESSSASPERMETISLDSISSDEEILSQSSKKKKHKHRHSSKSKRHKEKRSENDEESDPEKSKASRAGLTVLELLELQARARAIRAQLQQEQAAKKSTSEVCAEPNSSDNEVEIKEEPAEVFEISSEDEKPDLEKLQKDMQPKTSKLTEAENTVTKKVNDLIITIPQKPNRKIKLNRQKAYTTPTVPKTVVNDTTQAVTTNTDFKKDIDKPKETKNKKKQKKKKKDNNKDSDHDEITLQLSDSEKMDLLEDIDGKTFDKVSSSGTEDSESSSDSDSDETTVKETSNLSIKENTTETPQSIQKSENDTHIGNSSNCIITVEDVNTDSPNETINAEDKVVENDQILTQNEQKTEITESQITTIETTVSHDNNAVDAIEENIKNDNPANVDAENNTQNKMNENDQKSDGELSDRASSEIEAVDFKPEVVCISEDEKPKKKKKEKKSKKDKKKKDKDFRENSDENFYKEDIIINLDDDYEVYVLSDDSSCYEIEGTVLSKEPTTEEIVALSAKIDEIEREDVVTDKQIEEYENKNQTEQDSHSNPENISWKDRYLDSTKVKKVLTTANILNAIRKKNKELKNKMQKKIEEDKKEVATETPEIQVGSLEQYNTLESSTKYVDPVVEKDKEEEDKGKITKEMKKDAKQLLKMYKKLLKYNDMNKQKDPSKKKKNKQKKKDNKVKESTINTNV